MTKDKVFGIGLHKTGTTTLFACLEHLGYLMCPEAVGYLFRQSVAAEDYLPMLVLADRYEAFEDSPWNYKNVFKVLDAVFPRAKFVLTTRDDQSWLESLLRWTRANGSQDDLTWYQTLGTSVTIAAAIGKADELKSPGTLISNPS